MPSIRLSTFALALILFARVAVGGDWPQILGPHRNGQAAGEKLLDAWPKAGPPVLWTHPVGSGFAGPVAAGGRVIVFHREGDKERVEALAADSGKPLWKTDYDATYRGSINPDEGPRCVPVIHGDAVYVYGAAGDVHCLELATGKKRWSRAANEEYGAPDGYFGAGSTPIVAGDALLVNVGGRDGAGIVAFALKDGKTLWKSGDELASYSSPVLAEIDGQQRVVFVTRYNAVVVNPVDGKIAATFPFGQRGPTVNAASPLVFDGKLLLTSSYGIGAYLMQLKPDALKKIWASDDVLSSQYNTPVYLDGYLYGIHGREDIGQAALRCVNVKTGRVAWSEEKFGVANIIAADGKLLIVGIDGRLVLASARPDKYVELARAQVFNGTTRALPARSRRATLRPRRG